MIRSTSREVGEASQQRSSVSGSKKRAKILLVDDQPLIREGLIRLISSQQGLDVCGEVGNFSDARSLYTSTDPDMVIVNVRPQNGQGIEFIKHMVSTNPQVRILALLSPHAEALYAERALRSGALGCLNTLEDREKVLEAILAVLAGKRFLSAKVAEHLMEKAIHGTHEASVSPMAALSDRELEIFELIGRGVGTGAIAQQLHLSVHTIESHREKIKRKLKINSGFELTHYAIQWVCEKN